LNVVGRIPTPITPEESLRAVSQAWPSVFGAPATPLELSLILALVWIETARGTRCFNWNVFNITAGDTNPNDAWRPPWFDFDGGTNVTDRNVQLHELMLKGKAPKAFRSYTSIDAGALDGVRELKARYPKVVAAAATGDADSFRAALAELFSPDFSNPHATDTLAQFQNQFLAVQGEPQRPLVQHGVGRGVGIALGLGVAAAAVGLFVFTVHPPRRLRAVAA
jgi:hypothetical protein